MRVQQTPDYSLDLNIVAVSPEEHFASNAGIWLEPVNRVAYLEPVATDPDHRLLGLGRITVIDYLRRARDRGTSIAWVGSDQQFYTALGIEVTCVSDLWIKEPDSAP